jgi:hypothetical protein
MVGKSKTYQFRQSELKVDRSVHHRADIARDTQKAFPQLPVLFWEKKRHRNMYYKNASCARFPDVDDLHIYDLYWQSLRVKNFTVHLFSAYYDVRKGCPDCPAVRIIGMINSNWGPADHIYCHQPLTSTVDGSL